MSNRRRLAFASSLVAFAVSGMCAHSRLHAEPKGPRPFPATKEELATIRGFAQEQEELAKAIEGFVKRAAKDRGIPEDARFGWNQNARCWVLDGDVAAATSSAK